MKPAGSPPVSDKKSPAIEQRMLAAMRGRTSPTVPLLSMREVPQLREAPVALGEFLTERGRVLAGITPRARRRPPRSPYFAMEFSFDVDLCRVDRLDAARHVAPEYTAEQLYSRKRMADHWLRTGRLALHQLGGWPWALAPEGRLGRAWWNNERYWRALDEWATRDAE
jgi:hypothetical protein